MKDGIFITGLFIAIAGLVGSAISFLSATIVYGIGHKWDECGCIAVICFVVLAHIGIGMMCGVVLLLRNIP